MRAAVSMNAHDLLESLNLLDEHVQIEATRGSEAQPATAKRGSAGDSAKGASRPVGVPPHKADLRPFVPCREEVVRLRSFAGPSAMSET